MVAGSVLIIRMIFFNYLAALSLSCSMWDLVPWPGIKPEPPALGAGSLSPRTAREVPWWRFSEMIICPLLGWQDFINSLQFGSHYLRCQASLSCCTITSTCISLLGSLSQLFAVSDWLLSPHGPISYFMWELSHISLYPQLLVQSLTHSRCLVNIWWVKECIDDFPLL